MGAVPRTVSVYDLSLQTVSARISRAMVKLSGLQVLGSRETILLKGAGRKT